MWTVDMNRCPVCPVKDDCADRRKIIQALSRETMELNTDPAHVDGPGDGIIIVACRYEPPAQAE
jgi:hypothetical protein